MSYAPPRQSMTHWRGAPVADPLKLLTGVFPPTMCKAKVQGQLSVWICGHTNLLMLLWSSDGYGWCSSEEELNKGSESKTFKMARLVAWWLVASWHTEKYILSGHDGANIQLTMHCHTVTSHTILHFYVSCCYVTSVHIVKGYICLLLLCEVFHMTTVFSDYVLLETQCV